MARSCGSYLFALGNSFSLLVCWSRLKADDVLLIFNKAAPRFVIKSDNIVIQLGIFLGHTYISSNIYIYKYYNTHDMRERVHSHQSDKTLYFTSTYGSFRKSNNDTPHKMPSFTATYNNKTTPHFKHRASSLRLTNLCTLRYHLILLY